MYATDTDSGRLQAIQEACAIDLRSDGFGDGYDGKFTQSSEFDYLIGFAEGMIKANEEQQERTARFKEYVAREEALHRGESDWLDEVMATNDEPFLQFDCFDEF